MMLLDFEDTIPRGAAVITTTEIIPLDCRNRSAERGTSQIFYLYLLSRENIA